MTSPVLKFSGDLNAYAAHIHELNLKWWTNADGTPKDLDKGERFMLMVSELAEAMEGDRKDLMDDKLPAHKMILVELADTVIRVMDSGHVYGWNFLPAKNRAYMILSPSTMGGHLLNITSLIVQLAAFEVDGWGHVYSGPQDHKSDLASEIVDYCERLGGHSFWQIVYEKLEYNWTRADHAHANRQGLPGQKRY